jgi:hypothetical protein
MGFTYAFSQAAVANIREVSRTLSSPESCIVG